MLFAFFPVALGMSARIALPGVTDPNAVLPTIFLELLPPWLGALALAAVFSTAVDTCDGILFMLSTSLSQDVYRRHIRPSATDTELLRVARIIAVTAGVTGIALSIFLSTVIGALSIFYSVLGVSMFVPILGGLTSRRAGAPEALAAIAAGIATLTVVGLGPRVYPWLDPTLSGLLASAAAYLLALAIRRPGPRAHSGSSGGTWSASTIGGP